MAPLPRFIATLVAFGTAVSAGPVVSMRSADIAAEHSGHDDISARCGSSTAPHSKTCLTLWFRDAGCAADTATNFLTGAQYGWADMASVSAVKESMAKLYEDALADPTKGELLSGDGGADHAYNEGPAALCRPMEPQVRQCYAAIREQPRCSACMSVTDGDEFRPKVNTSCLEQCGLKSEQCAHLQQRLACADATKAACGKCISRGIAGGDVLDRQCFSATCLSRVRAACSSIQAGDEDGDSVFEYAANSLQAASSTPEVVALDAVLLDESAAPESLASFYAGLYASFNTMMSLDDVLHEINAGLEAEGNPPVSAAEFLDLLGSFGSIPPEQLAEALAAATRRSARQLHQA